MFIALSHGKGWKETKVRRRRPHAASGRFASICQNTGDQDAQILLGSGSFIPGFEDQLVGVAAGAVVLVARSGRAVGRWLRPSP